MEKNKTKRTAAGLHLWEVKVEHDHSPTRARTTTHLLITTVREDNAALAVQKAKTFVARHRRKFSNPKLISATHTGQIDA